MQTNRSGDTSALRAAEILGRRFRDGTLGEVVQDWKWILSFARARWRSMLLVSLLGLLSSGLSLCSGVLGKYLIDAIVYMNLDTIGLLIGLSIAAAALNVLLRSVSQRYSAKLSVDMQNDVRRTAFRQLLASDWQEISRYSSGDLMSRFSADLNTVASCAVSWLPTAVIQLFTLVATLAVILYYDPIMALIGFSSTPVLVFASNRLLRRQREYNRKQRAVASQLASFENETFRNINTLKSFGVEEKMGRELERWQDQYRGAAMDYNQFSIQTGALLSVMGTVVQYLAMGYCLWQLWRGQILFGTMTLFLQQRSTLTNTFTSLLSLIPTALSGSIAAERVRELTELKKEPATSPAPVSGGCTVELRNVEAAYGTEQNVLKNVSFRAAPGEIVALVGPSGEGKTTLLRLLLGLLKPESGTVTLTDSTGAAHNPGPDIRHWISYVPQGNTLLAGTIEENLRLGCEDATQEEILSALEAAQALDFVNQLPQGIHSTIGEGGQGLSEGQAQRIAIARALLRRAPVLLLDEVTSALDRETEAKVLKHLTGLGVTTILTTHRPSILPHCTRVYRVADGAMTELNEDEIRDLVGLEA